MTIYCILHIEHQITTVYGYHVFLCIPHMDPFCKSSWNTIERNHQRNPTTPSLFIKLYCMCERLFQPSFDPKTPPPKKNTSPACLVRVCAGLLVKDLMSIPVVPPPDIRVKNSRPYYGKPMVNKPLIGWGVHQGGSG